MRLMWSSSLIWPSRQKETSSSSRLIQLVSHQYWHRLKQYWNRQCDYRTEFESCSSSTPRERWQLSSCVISNVPFGTGWTDTTEVTNTTWAELFTPEDSPNIAIMGTNGASKINTRLTIPDPKVSISAPFLLVCQTPQTWTPSPSASGQGPSGSSRLLVKT